MVRQDLTLHQPFREDSCLTCHAPHVSREEGLLARAPAALCASCHDISTAALRTAHRGLLTSGSDCTGCHAPHASESKNLTLPVQHPPFAEGECDACHQGGGP